MEQLRQKRIKERGDSQRGEIGVGEGNRRLRSRVGRVELEDTEKAAEKAAEK